MNELLRRMLFLPPQHSTVALDIDSLHYVVILITMAGATLITVIGGYFLIRYRRRLDHPGGLRTTGRPGSRTRPSARRTPRPALRLEAAAVALLGVLFLGFWYVGVRQFIRLRVAPEGAMDVYVTGKQWMWKFGYPEGTSTLSTLYVPARTPVRLIMTSRDVIHSFFVPDFRIKFDVVPGRVTTAWFEAKAPGTFQILCTEFCGLGHSTMRGEVVALAPLDFERWRAGSPGDISAPPGARPTLPERGKRVAAEQGCLRCHTLDGTPHIGPTWAGLYGSVVPLVDGGEARADAAYITASMMDPAEKIHKGFTPVMPSYLGRIDPADTAAIIELIKSIQGDSAFAGPSTRGAP